MPLPSKYSKIAAAQQAEKTKTAAGEGDGVRYNLKNTTDKNVVSIKQQIENVAQELNAADPETKSQGLFHQIQKEVTFCGLPHEAYA